MATEVISREAQQEHPRWPVAATKVVRVDLGPAGAGQIVNVSYGGIRVKSLAPLRREAELPLRIEVPDAIPVQCSGVVVWSKPDGAAGLRFTKLSDDQKVVLGHWLAELEHTGGDRALQRDEFARTTTQIAAMKLNNADALRLIARRVVQVSSAAGVVIALGKAEHMVCLARLGDAPELGTSIRPGIGLVGECIRGRKMVSCHDAATDPRAGERKEGSELIVPLLVNGELRGLIQVLSPKAHAFDVKCMETVEKLADAAVFVTHNVMPQRRVANVTPIAKPVENVGSTIMKPSDSGKLKAFPVAVAPAIPPVTTSLEPLAVKPLPVVSVAEAPVEPIVASKPAPPISAPLVSSPVVIAPVPKIAAKTSAAKREYEFDMAEYAKARATTAARQAGHHAQPRFSVRWMIAVPLALAVVAVPLALYLRHSTPAVMASVSAPTVAPATAEPAAIAPVASAAREHAAVTLAPVAKPIPVSETTTHEAHEKKAALVETAQETKAKKEAAITEHEPVALAISSGVPIARHDDDTPDVAAPQMTMSGGTSLPGISLPTSSAHAPKLATPTAKPLTGGTLVQRVAPAYPTMALSGRVEGQVQLRAVITTQGVVEKIRPISGQPLLVQAAIDAVKRWRYDPFKSGGVPIEGEVSITLNFKIPR